MKDLMEFKQKYPTGYLNCPRIEKGLVAYHNKIYTLFLLSL